MHMSLEDKVLNAVDDKYYMRNLKSETNKNIENLLANNNILAQHLLKNYWDDESESTDDKFFWNTDALLKVGDEKDIGWNKRQKILSFIKIEDRYESELITINGSFFGIVYFIILSNNEHIWYFRTILPEDRVKQSLKYYNHVYRSIEGVRKQWRKEFLFKPGEVVAKNYLLNPHAAEVLDKDTNERYFFNLFTNKKQKEFWNDLRFFSMEVVDDWRKYFKEKKFMEKWMEGRISTLDYLLLVNKYASRSFNDTAQYPIMPWVGPWGANETYVIPPTSDEYRNSVRDLTKNSGKK